MPPAGLVRTVSVFVNMAMLLSSLVLQISEPPLLLGQWVEPCSQSQG